MTIQSTRNHLHFISHFGLLAAFCFTSVWAKDTTPEKDTDIPSIRALERFDAPRDAISRQVIRFADRIDTFFAGDRVYDELQESHIKIYILQTHFEHDNPVYDTKIKAKLNFPKTEKKLKLLVETDEDVEDEEGVGKESIIDTTTETEQSVGLRFIEKEDELWRVQTDALLRYRSDLELVTRLRIRRRFDFESWIFRLSENIFWYSLEGAGETTRLDIDHALSEKFLFRSATHATWKNKNGYFNYGQDFLLFQSINKRKALTYQAGIRAITEDRPHTTNYILSARYREEIHKGWLFYEVIPAINYPIESNHKPVRSISLKLEIVFDEN